MNLLNTDSTMYIQVSKSDVSRSDLVAISEPVLTWNSRCFKLHVNLTDGISIQYAQSQVCSRFREFNKLLVGRSSPTGGI